MPSPAAIFRPKSPLSGRLRYRAADICKCTRASQITWIQALAGIGTTTNFYKDRGLQNDLAPNLVRAVVGWHQDVSGDKA